MPRADKNRCCTWRCSTLIGDMHGRKGGINYNIGIKFYSAELVGKDVEIYTVQGKVSHIERAPQLFLHKPNVTNNIG